MAYERRGFSRDSNQEFNYLLSNFENRRGEQIPLTASESQGEPRVFRIIEYGIFGYGPKFYQS